MFHHAPVLVLVLGISIGIGQYYRVLGIGCLAWYRSNPRKCQITRKHSYQYKADEKHRAVILAKLCHNATYLPE